MSSKAMSQTQHPSTAFLCPLCCEETTAYAILSTCRHESCKSCLIKWIKKEEDSSQATSPTCPFCRLAMGQEDVVALLGRAFQPRRAAVTDGAIGGEGDVDELTLHWLHEHTKLCQGCGNYIEKESGCNMMSCLCGWRFCFNCGSHEGNCDCNQGHGFDDEHLHVPDDPIRDVRGFVDLRSCILRREIRYERESQREENEEEQNDVVCYDTSWLFLDRRADFRVLRQLTCKDRLDVHWARWRKSYQSIRDRPGIDAFIRSGAWLFNSTHVGSLEHLTRLSTHSKRSQETTCDSGSCYCYGEDGWYCTPCRGIYKDEKLNRDNILLLFP